MCKHVFCSNSLKIGRACVCVCARACGCVCVCVCECVLRVMNVTLLVYYIT